MKIQIHTKERHATDKLRYVDGSSILVNNNRQYSWKIDRQELIIAPYKIYTKMNLADISWFFETQNVKGFKTALDKRASDIKAANLYVDRLLSKQKKEEQKKESRKWMITKEHERILSIVSTVNTLISRVISGELEEGSMEFNAAMAVMTRSAGQSVFDLPHVNSGKISIEAYFVKLSKKLYDEIGIPNPNNPNDSNVKCVNEHYYPRSRTGGIDLYYYALEFFKLNGEFTTRDAITILHSNSEIAVTTKWQNIIALEPYQKAETFKGPDMSYQLANIMLVDCPPPPEHYFWVAMAKRYNIKLPALATFSNTISVEGADKLFYDSLPQTIKDMIK